MLKSSCRWILPLALLHSVATTASAEALLKVYSTSPPIPDDSYSTSCTIHRHGMVVIEHTTNLWGSFQVLKATETKKVKLSPNTLLSLIDEAATGTISGEIMVGGGEHKYVAFHQQDDGSTETVLLLDKHNALTNDSPAVKPLTKFIDVLCGDISQ